MNEQLLSNIVDKIKELEITQSNMQDKLDDIQRFMIILKKYLGAEND